jgi:hypothetical protein
LRAFSFEHVRGHWIDLPRHAATETSLPYFSGDGRGDAVGLSPLLVALEGAIGATPARLGPLLGIAFRLFAKQSELTSCHSQNTTMQSNSYYSPVAAHIHLLPISAQPLGEGLAVNKFQQPRQWRDTSRRKW